MTLFTTTTEAKIDVGSEVKSKSGYITKGTVTAFLPNSRTMVIVKDTDRGKGYDYNAEKYVGVKFPGGWSRGTNNSFNEEFTRHINQLTTIS